MKPGTELVIRHHAELFKKWCDIHTRLLGTPNSEWPAMAHV